MKAVLVQHKYLLVVIAAVLVQLNVLNNEFAYDDYPAIIENHHVQQGWSGVFEMVRHPYWHGVKAFKVDLDQQYVHYRPVVQLLHATEYQLFGEAPFPYHIVSLLIFVLLLLQIIKFLQLMGLSESVIIGAILLFGLTPIHTEVIANVKSQDELLAAVFVIAVFNSFLSWQRSKNLRYLVLALAVFVLAVFTKESTITVVGLVVAKLIWDRSSLKSSVLVLSGLVAVVGGMLLVRNAIIPASASMSNVYFFELSFVERLPSALKVLSNYAVKTFVPWPLIHSYDQHQMPRITWQDGATYVHLMAWLGIGVLTIRAFIKRQTWAFWSCFFLVTISVASHVLVPISTPFAERLVFLPSLGLYVLAMLLLVERLKWKQTVVAGLIGVVVVLYATGTVTRNAEWENNLTLFEADVNKAHQNFTPSGNLAYAYFDKAVAQSDKELAQRWFAKAATALDESIQLGGSKFDFLLRRGVISYELGQYDVSISHFQQALTKVDSPTAHYYLIRSAIQANKVGLAIQHLAALETNVGSYTSADLAGCYYKVGVSFVGAGDYENGMHYYTKALQFEDCIDDIHLSMGLIFNEIGLLDQAIRAFEKDVACRPDSKGDQYIELIRTNQKGDGKR